MNHADHVQLIRGGVTGDRWADLGSGTGAFTLALADILGTAGEIYSIDRDANALKQQAQAMQARFPDVNVTYQTGDFTQKLNLPTLDGIVMANSLHFIRDKVPVLELVKSYLKPDGRLILVEYGTDRGNLYVPYPLSFTTWQSLASKHGFTETQLLGKRPSRFLGEIYSAISTSLKDFDQDNLSSTCIHSR